MKKKLNIGLTGGIGSGKSTVARLFSEFGAPVIDADLISHQLTQVGTPAFKKIIEHFGKTLLNTDGSLNREKLKKIIFNAPEKKQWLEKLLHPVIRTHMTQQMEKIDYPYCILMIPLLAEVQPHPMVDRVLVVDIDPATQIQRVLLRDNMTKEQATKIIAAQASREARLVLADDVITNEGSLDELRAQVKVLHEKYLIILHDTLA